MRRKACSHSASKYNQPLDVDEDRVALPVHEHVIGPEFPVDQAAVRQVQPRRPDAQRGQACLRRLEQVQPDKAREQKPGRIHPIAERHAQHYKETGDEA